jgi:hypothetical protein
MSSAVSAELKRLLLALAAACAIAPLSWLAGAVASHFLWGMMAYFFLNPGLMLALVLNRSGTHRQAMTTAMNVVIYAGGTYLILRYRQKRSSRPPTQKQRLGFVEDILCQERTPVCTGVSVLASFLISAFMFLTFARWHENLGFAGLAVVAFYATAAFVGVLLNVILGCVGSARGESYAGGIAAGSGLVCVLAAIAFLLSTH